jgi:hypothetical protein
MFERFLRDYKVTPTGETTANVPMPVPRSDNRIRGWVELFRSFAGATFNSGIYRLHTPATAEAVHRVIGEALPRLRGIDSCFGYDWVGRQFALDFGREIDGEPAIRLIDLATPISYEIDHTFESLHNVEMVSDPQVVLESDVFTEWAAKNPHSLPLKRNQIVGYRIPLSLGGKHEVSNMVVEAMDVSLEFARQIHEAIQGSEEGTPIRGVDIKE